MLRAADLSWFLDEYKILKWCFLFREHVDERDEMFGVAEHGSGGFKYSEAPDRGWQQGKRDFTHKVSNSFLL